MSSKLRKIMKMKVDEGRGVALRKYAQELGVSLCRISDDGKFLEDELVNRIINAERSQREHRLWIVALLSCIGSILSAAAAWFAASNLKNSLRVNW